MRFLSGATIIGFWVLGVTASALAADPTPSIPRFEVSGIVLQDDGKAWALIAEPQLTGGAVRLLGPGAMIGPYRLVEVARDHVVMQHSSETPFRVPFSWRSGGAGTPGAARTPQSPQQDLPTTTRPPTRPAAPTLPTAPRTAPEGRAPVAPPPASASQADQGSDGAARSGAAAPAATGEPRVATPPRPRVPMDYDPAKIETLRRERERIFREELSIEGFHSNKPPAAPK